MLGRIIWLCVGIYIGASLMIIAEQEQEKEKDHE